MMSFNYNRSWQKLLTLGFLLSIFMTFPFKSNGQFYDFEPFNGSPLETIPRSFLGNKSITIKNLQFGQGDTLWIGTYKDGIVKWWQEGFTFWYVVNNLPGNNVNHIVELKSPIVLFTDYNSFTNTYSGLYRLRSTALMEDTTWTHIPYIANNPKQPITKINDLTTIGDSLVLFTTDSGLVEFNGFTKWKKTNKDNSANITEWQIDQVATTSTGGIYISSGNNIYRKIDKNWEHIELKEEPYNLKRAMVKEIRVGPKDTVWAITDKGIAKIHEESGYTWLNEDIKKIANEVKDVAFDNDGNPWMIFELNGGIRYLSQESGKPVWHQINSTNSDLPDEMSTIAVDNNGDMWFGTDSDGMFRFLSYTPGAIAQTLPDGLNVFPNPSNGPVQIEQTGLNDMSLEIVDIQGRRQQVPMNSDKVSVTLDKGIYILVFSQKGNTYHQKVVIY